MLVMMFAISFSVKNALTVLSTCSDFLAPVVHNSTWLSHVSRVFNRTTKTLMTGFDSISRFLNLMMLKPLSKRWNTWCLTLAWSLTFIVLLLPLSVVVGLVPLSYFLRLQRSIHHPHSNLYLFDSQTGSWRGWRAPHCCLASGKIEKYFFLESQQKLSIFSYIEEFWT